MKDNSASHYSLWVGSIYVFNLIVGTGALALPKAFQDAGWLLSIVVLSFLCFLSYVTTTYVIESMSITNGITKLIKRKYMMQIDNYVNNVSEDGETKTIEGAPQIEVEIAQRNYGTIQEKEQIGPSLENILPIEDNIGSYFEITETYEMGDMAIKYFNKCGLVLFYLSMCIYLYGDLAVYAAAVPTSLRDVSCTYQLNHTQIPGLISVNRSLSDSDPCWPNSSISRMNAYRIFLSIFVVLCCPFVFFNLTKTKALQVTTLTMRWFAFIIMFVLMIIYLGNGNKFGNPKPVVISRSPNFVGICIYAFMCHHSLPSLVTPINKKRFIYLMLLVNFIIILGFYLCLSLLSSFTFADIKSLINLNFNGGSDYIQPPVTNIAFFQYYLMLFPVFSLSTSFPIIGITLRNNLKNLIVSCTGRQSQSAVFDTLFYPLLTIIPPLIIVYCTDNIQFLVGFTGSYAGSVIQYIVPISLVICARKQMKELLSHWDEDCIALYGISREQLTLLHRSPFRNLIFVVVIVLWTVISVAFVTFNHIKRV